MHSVQTSRGVLTLPGAKLTRAVAVRVLHDALPPTLSTLTIGSRLCLIIPAGATLAAPGSPLGDRSMGERPLSPPPKLLPLSRLTAAATDDVVVC